ncbi:hypothetical protein BYT27DRAFT_7226574 [Phlegmacium glaucopus]|nr:hypothetical protein BYT27DRAFT_7226574 [Phlegmacium glaucopus]
MTESTNATPPNQENPYPPPVVSYPPPGSFNGSPYPPGPPGAYPPFYPYPPPPDGTHPEGAQNGVPPAPYMMFAPPGVMYYPPHPQAQSFGAPAPNPASPALSRPKRKQVKMACTNCAGACKRCDETRPCERCVKYGIADSCVDGQRKERKKGIKRGPYKRKNKDGDSANYSGEWPPGSQPPSASTTAAAIHAVSQYAPEGYYPAYYPPPGTFMHPHEGQSGPDGSPHPNGQPHMMPYYIPGGYPPFGHYPPMYPPQGVASSSGAPLQAPPPTTQQPAQGQVEQPQTINPADAARKPDDPSSVTGEKNGTGAAGAVSKKRSKTKNGESKAKKAKTAAAARPESAKEEEIPQPPPAHSKPPANDESDSESPVTSV